MKNVRLEKYIKAISEADRFLSKAKLAKKELEANEFVYSSKLNASAKRSSMDLSRALSELRKTDY